MLPFILCSLLLFGLLLCFPLGVFPLPVLALKERLYLREQDTGKGLYLVIGNPRAVVIGLLSARHGITPLKLPLVEQIALKHYAIPSDETAPCVLGYLFGGAGVVENNLRKHAVCSAANTEIHVVAYLTGDDGRIRPLRGENKVDAERPPLPPRAVSVYMYLKDRSNSAGSCWPGIKTIARDMNLSRSTVKRALADLEQHGYLAKLPRYRPNGSNTSNLYTLK